MTALRAGEKYTMPRRIDDRRIYLRYSNGMCVIDRICRECGHKFIGERNICPPCRNKARRKTGKYNAQYHRRYYHSKYSKMALLHNEGDMTRKGKIAELRKAAFEKQKCRIRAEMIAIMRAGLDPANDTIERIQQAGIQI